MGPGRDAVRWVERAPSVLAFIVDDKHVILVHPMQDTEHQRIGDDVGVHCTYAPYARDYADLLQHACTLAGDRFDPLATPAFGRGDRRTVGPTSSA